MEIVLSIVAVLAVVGVFALVDRQIFGMLIEPLKQEFDVSDTELGLASGLSFALFYGAAGLPIARLADRGNRRNILAAGLGAWSALALVSGFATSFAQLVVAPVVSANPVEVTSLGETSRGAGGFGATGLSG